MSARIDIATSSGVRAPMSRPAGVITRRRRPSSTSRTPTTALPRFGLATSPTYPTSASSAATRWSISSRPWVATTTASAPSGSAPVGSSWHHLVAERATHPSERPRDRAVADDRNQRRRPPRLEEDLQRPTGQARVVGHQLARYRILGSRADPQDHALARVEHGERVRPHRGLGAVAADEPLHRPVRQHDRLVAWVGARRLLGEHHPGVDERHALALVACSARAAAISSLI